MKQHMATTPPTDTDELVRWIRSTVDKTRAGFKKIKLEEEKMKKELEKEKLRMDEQEQLITRVLEKDSTVFDRLYEKCVEVQDDMSDVEVLSVSSSEARRVKEGIIHKQEYVPAPEYHAYQETGETQELNEPESLDENSEYDEANVFGVESSDLEILEDNEEEDVQESEPEDEQGIEDDEFEYENQHIDTTSFHVDDIVDAEDEHDLTSDFKAYDDDLEVDYYSKEDGLDQDPIAMNVNNAHSEQEVDQNQLESMSRDILSQMMHEIPGNLSGDALEMLTKAALSHVQEYGQESEGDSEDEGSHHENSFEERSQDEEEIDSDDYAHEDSEVVEEDQNSSEPEVMEIGSESEAESYPNSPLNSTSEIRNTEQESSEEDSGNASPEIEDEMKEYLEKDEHITSPHIPEVVLSSDISCIEPSRRIDEEESDDDNNDDENIVMFEEEDGDLSSSDSEMDDNNALDSDQHTNDKDQSNVSSSFELDGAEHFIIEASEADLIDRVRKTVVYADESELLSYTNDDCADEKTFQPLQNRLLINLQENDDDNETSEEVFYSIIQDNEMDDTKAANDDAVLQHDDDAVEETELPQEDGFFAQSTNIETAEEPVSKSPLYMVASKESDEEQETKRKLQTSEAIQEPPKKKFKYEFVPEVFSDSDISKEDRIEEASYVSPFAAQDNYISPFITNPFESDVEDPESYVKNVLASVRTQAAEKTLSLNFSIAKEEGSIISGMPKQDSLARSLSSADEDLLPIIPETQNTIPPVNGTDLSTINPPLTESVDFQFSKPVDVKYRHDLHDPRSEQGRVLIHDHLQKLHQYSANLNQHTFTDSCASSVKDDNEPEHMEVIMEDAASDKATVTSKVALDLRENHGPMIEQIIEERSVQGDVVGELANELVTEALGEMLDNISQMVSGEVRELFQDSRVNDYTSREEALDMAPTIAEAMVDSFVDQVTEQVAREIYDELDSNDEMNTSRIEDESDGEKDSQEEVLQESKGSVNEEEQESKTEVQTVPDVMEFDTDEDDYNETMEDATEEVTEVIEQAEQVPSSAKRLVSGIFNGLRSFTSAVSSFVKTVDVLNGEDAEEFENVEEREDVEECEEHEKSIKEQQANEVIPEQLEDDKAEINDLEEPVFDDENSNHEDIKQTEETQILLSDYEEDQDTPIAAPVVSDIEEAVLGEAVLEGIAPLEEPCVDNILEGSPKDDSHESNIVVTESKEVFNDQVSLPEEYQNNEILAEDGLPDVMEIDDEDQLRNLPVFTAGESVVNEPSSFEQEQQPLVINDEQSTFIGVSNEEPVERDSVIEEIPISNVLGGDTLYTMKPSTTNEITPSVDMSLADADIAVIETDPHSVHFDENASYVDATVLRDDTHPEHEITTHPAAESTFADMTMHHHVYTHDEAEEINEEINRLKEIEHLVTSQANGDEAESTNSVASDGTVKVDIVTELQISPEPMDEEQAQSNDHERSDFIVPETIANSTVVSEDTQTSKTKRKGKKQRPKPKPKSKTLNKGISKPKNLRAKKSSSGSTPTGRVLRSQDKK